MESVYDQIRNAEIKNYQDAVNTVCLMCCEDTLTDETVCNNCPVRKTVDMINREKEN